MSWEGFHAAGMRRDMDAAIGDEVGAKVAPSIDQRFRENEKRPLEYDEPDFYHSATYGTLSGGLVFALTALIKEGVETWIRGSLLLVLSVLGLALWLSIVGPIVTKFIDTENELDRGWHPMWMLINVFIAGTLAFVGVQVGSDIFLRNWKDTGITPYEAVLFLFVILTIFYGTFQVVRRVPAAVRGTRSV